MGAEIRVDESLCMGHAPCESLRPDLFETDDAGAAHWRGSDVDAANLGELEEIVGMCPMAALTLRRG